MGTKGNQTACGAIRGHFHDFTAANIKGNEASFAIIRDPCERFTSQAFSMWQGTKRLRMFRDPVALAKLLLSDSNMRHLYLYHGTEKIEAFRARSMWQQSAYIHNNTFVLCLPTLQE